MTDTPTCPRPKCDRPLKDTHVVCDTCATILAVALRNAAANWDELEAAVARQTAIYGDSGAATKPRTLNGPTDIPCEHDSCLRVRQSQLRARNESPISGETNHISFGAHESAWEVTNTATTWARLINEESGRPIPDPSPPKSLRADPLRVTVRRGPTRDDVIARAERRGMVVMKSPSPALCDYSWLPIKTCACGHPHPTKETA